MALIPPDVVAALSFSIVVLNIIYFFRYRDWFVLSLAVPLGFTFAIFLEDVFLPGDVERGIARAQLVLILVALLVQRIFSLIEKRIRK